MMRLRFTRLVIGAAVGSLPLLSAPGCIAAASRGLADLKPHEVEAFTACETDVARRVCPPQIEDWHCRSVLVEQYREARSRAAYLVGNGCPREVVEYRYREAARRLREREAARVDAAIDDGDVDRAEDDALP